MATKRLSGKAVIVGFFLVVGMVGLGLWIALDAARDTFLAETEARTAGAAGNGGQASSEWLRVNLDTGEGGDLPFYLRIPNDGADAVIRNGEEEISAATQRFDDGAYLLDFPHYDSRLTLEPDASGGFTGVYTKTRGGGEVAEMAAVARAIETPLPEQRFPVSVAPVDGPDFSGEWRMDFVSGGLAKGVFEQDESGALAGTILTPTGDYRFLAGNLVDGQMRISVFDGSHAFLFTGDLDDAGQAMTGHFYSGGYYHDTFTATRLSPGDSFEMPDAFSEIALVEGETRLGIERLREAPYAGAPTIVVVFGTWCPNCNDEAPLLKRLYDEHHADGLQILGLAYEHTEDAERSQRQIDRFKERYGLTWEILAAGVSDKQQTAATLPSISTIKSYPTTIWVNPDGTVRAIHSGFAGPATGDAWTETQAEYEQLTREIVEAQ